MFFFNLDVILQAFFSYIWDERGVFDEKVAANEKLDY